VGFHCTQDSGSLLGHKGLKQLLKLIPFKWLYKFHYISLISDHIKKDVLAMMLKDEVTAKTAVSLKIK
jgi:hypothetical protein